MAHKRTHARTHVHTHGPPSPAEVVALTSGNAATAEAMPWSWSQSMRSFKNVSACSWYHRHARDKHTEGQPCASHFCRRIRVRTHTHAQTHTACTNTCAHTHAHVRMHRHTARTHMHTHTHVWHNLCGILACCQPRSAKLPWLGRNRYATQHSVSCASATLWPGTCT